MIFFVGKIIWHEAIFKRYVEKIQKRKRIFNSMWETKKYQITKGMEGQHFECERWREQILEEKCRK